jgi:cyclophilin family peptidyl-prolyl cis-trans isomerase
MASSGKDDNSSQFFFTLNRADELNGKHTLFGKVREREGERREREREGGRYTRRQTGRHTRRENEKI